jgi:thiol-disulfide isomerase/thioredoxin
MASRWLLGGVIVLVAVSAGIAGHLGYRHWQARVQAQDALEQLRGLRLSDLQGISRSLTDWRGKLLVVNFWATWCEPCREEVPALQRVRNSYAADGVEVIGIAFDSASKVQQFATEFGVTYPLLVGGLEAIDVTRKLGNRAGGLPYTVVLDRHGKLALAHLGAISEARLRAALDPLLSPTAEYPANSGIWWTTGPHLRQTAGPWPRQDAPPHRPSAAASSFFTDPT